MRWTIAGVMAPVVGPAGLSATAGLADDETATLTVH